MVIPRHSPSLRFRDYAIYISSLLHFGKNTNRPLGDIWKPLIKKGYFLPTPTGRHALWYFLENSGLKKGDEVLVSSYNFYVVIRLLLQKGLVPVFVDIDPDTLSMDTADLKKKITKKSRLVFVTHMFGNPVDLGPIRKLCREKHLLLFEDCAHAIGSSYKGVQVGQGSEGALFSFGVFKLINTFGGGMLVSSKKQFVNLTEAKYLTGLASVFDNLVRFCISVFLRPLLHTVFLYPAMKIMQKTKPNIYRLIDPSKNDPRYRFHPEGRAPFKPFMKTMMISELKKLRSDIVRRKQIADMIKSQLEGVKKIKFLMEDKFGLPNYSYFGLYVPDPDKLAKFLETKGILSCPHEYYDCARLAQFSEYRRNNKHADYAARHLIRLPNFPAMSRADIKRMTSGIKEFLRG